MSERAILLSLLIVLQALLLILKPRWGDPGSREPVHVLYVSIQGIDSDSGDQQHPLHTLSRAEQIVSQSLTEKLSHFEIRVLAGTYYGQSVNWHAFHPRINIVIRADDPAHPAVFDGRPSIFASARLNYFIKTSPEDQTMTNFSLQDLKIQNYEIGAWLEQSSKQSREPLRGRNHIVNCDFSKMKTAILIENSGDNSIADNSFSQISGDGTIRIIRHSNANKIVGNRFSNLIGPALSFQDESDFNSVELNRFENISSPAVETQVFKNSCPSWENRIAFNETVGAAVIAQTADGPEMHRAVEGRERTVCANHPGNAKHLVLVNNSGKMHVVRTKTNSDGPGFVGFCPNVSDCAGPLGTCHAANSVHKHLYCFQSEWHRCSKEKLNTVIGTSTCTTNEKDYAWQSGESSLRSPAALPLINQDN